MDSWNQPVLQWNHKSITRSPHLPGPRPVKLQGGRPFASRPGAYLPLTSPLALFTMSFRTHVLACMFGMGSWVAINGMWVELPLIVPQIPESWHLPSYLTVLIQAANVGPLLVTLLHYFRPGVVNEGAVIYGIAAVGCLACLLLAFLWHHTVEVAGARHSVPLLSLTFFLSVVDCTSSVTFLPFMMRLQPQYLTTYFIGEGLSGLVPALAALVQGVGVVHCHNATQKDNGTRVNASETGQQLEAHYQPANFSTQTFFIFLTAMMVACMCAFHLLNRHPSVRQEHMGNGYLAGQKEEPGLRLQSPLEPKPMVTPVNCHQGEQRSTFGSGTYSTTEVLFIFVVLAWVNALTNTVLPSVQTYSCLPYGNKAYHLAAAMGALANPLACFIAMFVPVRSLKLMGFLSLSGTGFGAYIMFVAAMSPCPLLVHSGSGTVLIPEMTLQGPIIRPTDCLWDELRHRNRRLILHR
nr:riboflavin transporter 2-like isoform X2 [Paramormyrops kingsleyae]